MFVYIYYFCFNNIIIYGMQILCIYRGFMTNCDSASVYSSIPLRIQLYLQKNKNLSAKKQT